MIEKLSAERGKRAWFVKSRSEDGTMYMVGDARFHGWQFGKSNARRFQRKADAQEAIDAYLFRCSKQWGV